MILSLLAHAKDAINGDTTDATRAFFRHMGKRLWDEHDAVNRSEEYRKQMGNPPLHL